MEQVTLAAGLQVAAVELDGAGGQQAQLLGVAGAQRGEDGGGRLPGRNPADRDFDESCTGVHTYTCQRLQCKENSVTERVVLAYSGGLDTSVAIGWIAEETGAEVIAVAVDVGQGGEDLDVIRKRA